MRMQNTEPLTPRDRVEGELLRQLLAEEDGAAAVSSPRGARPAAAAPQRPSPSLAMVYSPEQAFTDLYEPEKGLSRGTIFARLDMPFYGAACTARR